MNENCKNEMDIGCMNSVITRYNVNHLTEVYITAHLPGAWLMTEVQFLNSVAQKMVDKQHMVYPEQLNQKIHQTSEIQGVFVIIKFLQIDKK